ncbi:hypothetical protein K438DRAFT_863802 [Mycena galopus ATCC 62051]|nr:hypothetical protein K438DRAFT_863802 [Mycena galopus ATCC 62051]
MVQGEITTERMDRVKLGLEGSCAQSSRLFLLLNLGLVPKKREIQTDDAKPPFPGTSTAQSLAASRTAGLGTSRVSLNPQGQNPPSSTATEQRAEASTGTAANTLLRRRT